MRLIPEEIRIQQINNLPNIKFIKWHDTYSGNSSKAVVRCLVDGYSWSARISDMISHGSGCPQCAGNRRWTGEERIEQINKLDNIEFVSWIGKYKTCESKAKVRCSVDGFEWDSSVGNLLHSESRCTYCLGLRKWTEQERINQINSIGGVKFISWVSTYKGRHSRLIAECLIDGGRWTATVSGLVNARNGCPRCAKYGYQLDKKGYLYALRSECGLYVKVGISNNPSRRHRQLERSTPFEFSLIEQISGVGEMIANLEKHFHSKYESACFTGFDGATEWLVCTDDLLKELIEVAQ